ncbi:MAG: c-type cytochrome [Thiotrichales bacterium]
MQTLKILVTTLVLAATGTLTAAAQPATAPTQEWDPARLEASLAIAASGNAEAGERLNHFYYCSSCHGETGASVSRNWPSLTGQRADYLVKTLIDYRENMRRDSYRKSEVMHRVAQLLSDQDMADLAAYYATHSAPPVPPQTDRELAKSGQKLADEGDGARGVAACAGCHGAQGESGVTPDTPALAGQTPEYFIQAMQMYRSGMRTSDVGGMMRMFANPLSDAEIEALAHYYASLGQPVGVSAAAGK